MISTSLLATDGLYPGHSTFNIATVGYGSSVPIAKLEPAIILSFPKFIPQQKRYNRTDNIDIQFFGFDNVTFVDFLTKRIKQEDDMLTSFLLMDKSFKCKNDQDKNRTSKDESIVFLFIDFITKLL